MSHTASAKKECNRILICRTDRIGDVLLSTPVIRAVREAFPSAYIAMVVSPAAKEVVEANPWLDKVFVYDKLAKHKSWLGTLRFALRLKKERFDLCLILHPTNRMHWVSFLAGIPRRVGYDRKSGFLLTERMPHHKHFGAKHESEYTLDMVRYAGIETHGRSALYMPLRPEAEAWVRELFISEGLKETDRILAIHPAASCPSKIWPAERFAEAADRLAEKYGFKLAIIAGPKDMARAGEVVGLLKHPVLNLAGRTSVAQLAAFLKRCSLFVSNDSGPVHIASAVGTPVISIFGRNQKGLSPRRWGPLGEHDKVLHKQVGCIECRAHNCIKGFVCLKAITAEDVLNAAADIMRTVSS